MLAFSALQGGQFVAILQLTCRKFELIPCIATLRRYYIRANGCRHVLTASVNCERIVIVGGVRTPHVSRKKKENV